MRINARLMFSASPNPTASAMRSTGSIVVSIRPRLDRYGVVPPHAPVWSRSAFGMCG